MSKSKKPKREPAKLTSPLPLAPLAVLEDSGDLVVTVGSKSKTFSGVVNKPLALTLKEVEEWIVEAHEAQGHQIDSRLTKLYTPSLRHVLQLRLGMSVKITAKTKADREAMQKHAERNGWEHLVTGTLSDPSEDVEDVGNLGIHMTFPFESPDRVSLALTDLRSFASTTAAEVVVEDE